MTTYKMRTVHLQHFTNTQHAQDIYCTVCHSINAILLWYTSKINPKWGLIGKVPVLIDCTLKESENTHGDSAPNT